MALLMRYGFFQQHQPDSFPLDAICTKYYSPSIVS